MAAAPGFSIATSLSGAIGGVPSPIKSGRPITNWKAPTAAQLLDQIKNLEAEGNKLRAESAALFGSSALGELNASNSSAGKPESSQDIKHLSLPPNLSALVDISSEQKTISDLRQQLDQQRKETDRLSSHLLTDGFSASSSRVGTVLHIPSSPSKTGFSTLPSTELFSSRRISGTSSAIETGPPSHMEKALKDSQEQVADLRRRLIEANELTESQKRQFRLSIEELKAKLHDTMINKDTLMDLKHKEVINLENTICELEATVKELQHKLKVQEQSLQEASRKADGYSRENFLSETTLNQVRVILVEAERRRGKAYFESDPASQQSPAMLVHTLERCIQEMNKDTELNRSRVIELEKELSEVKKTQTSDQKNLSFEHHQSEDETVSLCRRITQMTAEHEKQLQVANEKITGLRKQVSSLETQLSGIQHQHEHQLRLKEETMKEMENKVKHLREELHEERENYSSKRENLEQTLSGTEKEMSKLRSERDEACRNQSAMESKVADLQLTINRLNREIQTEKEAAGKFWDREGQLRSKQSEIESRLDEKTREVDRLEKMLATVKQECNATVSEKISMIERQERERHMDKISSLTSQLSEVSEKCNKASLELETTKTENRDLRAQLRELSERTDTTKVQYEAAAAEKKHLTDMLTAKKSDYERVSQERDYYFNMMEQKNTELNQVKTLKERLSLQLEEREKNVNILQEQMAKLQQVLETTSSDNQQLQEERDIYLQKLQETTTALEELKSIRDNMAKKMKIREKKVKELETERQKMAEEMDLKTKEMAIIQQEKETIFKELKESRYEVSSLSEEKDELKKEYESTKYQLEKTIGKLQYRIKTLDHDLSLTQKALRKRESVDNTAVKMADKMQKEVTAKRSQIDTLQSKVKWFQDQIDTLVKEKCHLEEGKDKLKTSLNKSLVQSQHLATELETANNRCLELKEYASKMESSLEKAVLRNATTQSQVEMFEQEITRMKLAHQLEVKEAVQKALSQRGESRETVPRFPESGRGTSVSTNDASRHRGPEHVAKSDRLKAQRSGENYKELGSELKCLLDEMRTLISDKKEADSHPSRSTQPSRLGRERSHTVQALPITKKPAFMHYRVAPTDVSYHSDTEADDRVWHNRSRTLTGTYGLYSPERDLPKDQSNRRQQKKHRRSKSAEASFSLTRDDSSIFDSDFRPSGLSSQAPESDITESSSPSPELPQIPDTQELCRRLEEKIASLTKMGGTLQKENKEMAELMKCQGRKLQKVKATEKQIRKKKR